MGNWISGSPGIDDGALAGIETASVKSPCRAPTPELKHRNEMYATLATDYTNSVLGYVSDDPEKRHHIVGHEQAIEMTRAVRRKMDHIVFFTDFGMSSGMRAAKKLAKHKGIDVLEVKLEGLPGWGVRLSE